MVRHLIRLTLTIHRHSLSEKRLWGLAIGIVAAVATWAALITASPQARADVLTLVLAFWFTGWLLGPILGSGTAILRPEYFTLMPLPRHRLGAGLLASAFVGAGAAVTVGATLVLSGYGVTAGSAVAALVGIVAAALFVVLIVALSRSVYMLLGTAMRTGLGVEIAAVQYGLLIASLFAGWLVISFLISTVPVFLEGRFVGTSAGEVLGWTPAGWPVRAVEAAATGDLAAAAGWLGLLGAATLVAVGLAARLLTPFVGNRTARRRRRVLGARDLQDLQVLNRRRLLPGTPFGAVLGKELRTWWRDPWRSLEIRSSIWFGLFLAVFGAIGGIEQLAGLSGVGVALMVALSAANLYGQDGTALWQLVVTQRPSALRADIRGRQAALVVFFGIPAIVLTMLMMVLIAGYSFLIPVLATIMALLGAGSGVAVLMTVVGVTPGIDPHRRVNASDAGENPFVIQIALLATMLTVAPTLAMAGTLAFAGSSLPGWFTVATVAIGVVNAVVPAWAFGALAVHRITTYLPETFARLRYPGTVTGHGGGGWLDQLSGKAEKEVVGSGYDSNDNAP